MTLTILLLVILAMAYANGVNGNFKGVATLFGSGTTDYRGALLWATTATFPAAALLVAIAFRVLVSMRDFRLTLFPTVAR